MSAMRTEEKEARARLTARAKEHGCEAQSLPKRGHREGDEYCVLRAPEDPSGLAEEAGLGPFVPSCVPVADAAKDWEVVVREIRDPQEALRLASSMNTAHHVMSQ